MQIVEEQHERILFGDGADQVDEGARPLERQFTLAAGRIDRTGFGAHEARHQRREYRRRRGSETGGAGQRGERRDDVAEQRVRIVTFTLMRLDGDDADATARHPPFELAQQTGLPHPSLSDHQEALWLSRLRAPPGGEQCPEGLGTPLKLGGGGDARVRRNLLLRCFAGATTGRADEPVDIPFELGIERLLLLRPLRTQRGRFHQQGPGLPREREQVEPLPPPLVVQR